MLIKIIFFIVNNNKMEPATIQSLTILILFAILIGLCTTKPELFFNI